MAAKKTALNPSFNPGIRFKVERVPGNKGLGLEWRLYQTLLAGFKQHLAWHNTKREAQEHAQAMKEALQGFGRRKHTGKVGKAVLEGLGNLDEISPKSKKNKKRKKAR